MAVSADLQVELDADIASVLRVIEDFIRNFPKRDLAGVIRQQGKLLIRDLLKLTPPSAGLTLGTSFGQQKLIGNNKVAGDINTVFADIRTLGIFHSPHKPEVGQHATDLLNARRYDELQRFLVDCGYGYRVPAQSVMAAPTEELHDKQRDGRGRVHEKKKTKYWVGRPGAIRSFIRKKQKLVGRLKAGWVPGAQALGAPVPGWVAKQSAQGGVINQLDQPDPAITFRNGVSYAVKNDQDARYVSYALKIRKGALMRQIQAKLDGRIRAAG